MRRFIRLFLALALALAWSGVTSAHSMAPALLELEERAGGKVIVRLKQNLSPSLAQPFFPPQCEILRSFVPQKKSDAYWRRWLLDCGVDGLPKGQIGWSKLTETNVVLRLLSGDEERQSVLLHRNQPSYRISGSGEGSAPFGRAVGSGVSHLFAGLDHLLFIIGLVLYLGRTRKLIVAVSFFTVGHSLSLMAVTIGMIRPPSTLVEIAIAGSILYLAVILHKTRCRPADPGWANLLLMPVGFGLLHGMGFASVLESSGLRSGDLLVNLLGFNLGIELGQLACIGFALLFGQLVMRSGITSRWRYPVTPALVWLMGSVAAYWWWERIVALAV